MAVEAMQHGAVDFLQKPFSDKELTDRIQRALAADRRNRELLGEKEQIRARLAMLTRRERQVLELVTRGKSNKVIAGDLGVSQRTVEIHRAHLTEKMCATSLAHLVRMTMIADIGTSTY
jgi:FixJ family two-component response regulator